MVSEVLYRNADPEDLSGIAALFLAAFPESIEHYVGHPIGPSAIEDAFAIALDAEPGAFFVAEVGGRIAGYSFTPSKFSNLVRTALLGGRLLRMSWRWITGRYKIGSRPVKIAVSNWLNIWREARKEEHQAEARILSIAVHPDFQGMGIGTGLMRRGIAYLKEKGERTIRLEVRPENAAAVHVYEKLGFEAKGRTRDTQGEWLIMLCDLAGEER